MLRCVKKIFVRSSELSCWPITGLHARLHSGSVLARYTCGATGLSTRCFEFLEEISDEEAFEEPFLAITSRI